MTSDCKVFYLHDVILSNIFDSIELQCSQDEQGDDEVNLKIFYVFCNWP